MKAKNGVKEINVTGWELYTTTYFYFQKEWVTSKKREAKKGKGPILTVRSYRHNFNNEIIRARLVSIFDHNESRIQMWWENNNEKKMNTIIKIDGQWHKLEKREKWIVRLMRRNKEIAGIVIHVFDEEYPRIILQEIQIMK